jgi:ubiquinone/menaquinone biosynthesis C-methylase UbiE
VKRVITRYSWLEAYLYDRFIAPVVMEISRELSEEFAGQVPENAEVLDVGCGGGQFAIQLSELRNDVNVTGLDLSPGQIRRARKRAKRAGVNTRFVEGSALNLPFENEGFHIVYSMGSIKHWPDMTEGLRECLRVLKKGGILMVSEVDSNCPEDVALSFVSKWKFPFMMKKRALRFFQDSVSGGSIGIEDAGEMAACLDVSKAEVSLILDGFSWVLVAIK